MIQYNLSLPWLKTLLLLLELQESRVIARKSRDAAAVRCGSNFADIHYNLRVAKLRKPAGFRAIDVPVKNRI